MRAPLKTSAITRSAQPSGTLAEPGPGVGGADPDPRLRVQRQLLADELDQRGVHLDDLLGGAGAGGGDVAGEGEGAAAQVHDVQGRPGGATRSTMWPIRRW